MFVFRIVPATNIETNFEYQKIFIVFDKSSCQVSCAITGYRFGGGWAGLALRAPFIIFDAVKESKFVKTKMVAGYVLL